MDKYHIEEKDGAWRVFERVKNPLARWGYQKITHAWAASERMARIALNEVIAANG